MNVNRNGEAEKMLEYMSMLAKLCSTIHSLTEQLNYASYVAINAVCASET